jgi:Uma2 family endonuclease
VEVLSRSTQDADRREKLWASQQLPSLHGYLLIDTATRAAHLYTCSGDGWSGAYAEGQGVFTVPCVNITLALDTIYEATTL